MRAKTLRLCSALLLLLLAAGRGEAAEAKKETVLAVMDIINNTGEFSTFVEGMPDMLITELLSSGDVKLVERTKVQTAMKALKIETSGLTQERNVELGKWLGVDGILFGAFNRVGDMYRLDIRAIDVQTGKINVAASAVSGKDRILDMIPEIGSQLRNKLATPGKAGERRAPPMPVAKAPPPDSCDLQVQYKTVMGIFAEVSVPQQRVRVYLDNRLIHESDVIDAINQYFELYRGPMPVGTHTLKLVHGSVDRQGRWLRELEEQPDPCTLRVAKGDRPSVKYRMKVEDRWNTFTGFQTTF